MLNFTGLMLMQILADKNWEFKVFRAKPKSEFNKCGSVPRLCLSLKVYSETYTIRLDDEVEIMSLFNRILPYETFPEE